MFDINPTLRENVFKDMSQDWTPVTKAVYIYNQLCSRLQYSIDYFLDEHRVQDWYSDPKNLSAIDGVNNNQVVCYTIAAIYAQMLLDAGVCDEEFISAQSLLTKDKTRFGLAHDTLMFGTIDGHMYDVDFTDGILNRCDLTLSKFGRCAFSGWSSIAEAKEDRYADMEALDEAQDVIFEQEDELEALAATYRAIKSQNYEKLSLQDRFDLFMTYMKDTPEYSVESFTYLIKLKHALFTRAEVGDMGVSKNFELTFVKDVDTKEFKAMIMYNPDGYVADKGFENFDSLQIYEFSVKNREVTTNIDREELSADIESGRYTGPKGGNSTIAMLKNGSADITPIPPEGEEFEYDQYQKPINVDHYVRKEKLTGKTYVCDAEGNNLETQQKVE